MSIEAIPYILVLGLIYGTTLIATSFGIDQFHSMTFIGLRLALSSLAFLFIFSFSIRGYRFPTDKRLWKHAIILGIFGTALPMNLMAGSLYFVSSGVVGIMITIGPAITVILAHFFLSDERLNLRKGIGVALALTGALVLTLLGESGLPDVSTASPLGYIMLFIALFSGNSMNIYVRRFMGAFDVMQVSAVRIITAALITLPLSFIFVGFDLSKVTTSGWLVLAWAAIIGTFISALLAFYNIQRFGATISAIVAYLVPVIASILGVVLLHETITPGMLFAMVVIILGVAILNERPGRTVVVPPGTD